MPKPWSKSVGGPPKAFHFVITLNEDIDCMGRRGRGGDPNEPGLHMGIRRGGSEGDPLGILGGSSAKMGDPV